MIQFILNIVFLSALTIKVRCFVDQIKSLTFKIIFK